MEDLFDSKSLIYDDTVSLGVSIRDALTRQVEFLRLVESLRQKRTILFLDEFLGSSFVTIFLECLKRSIPVVLIPANTSMYRLEDLYSAFSPTCHLKYNANLDTYDVVTLSSSNESLPVDDKVALMILTSGSTGRSKVCCFSLKNLVTSSYQIANGLAIESTDTAIITLPLSYVYGLTILTSHLIAGANISFCRSGILSADFSKLIRIRSPSSFGGVPSQFKTLVSMLKRGLDLTGLRYFTQAGGKLGEDYLNELISFSKRSDILFYVMYGQSEATSRISIANTSDPNYAVGSVGKVVAGGQLHIDPLPSVSLQPTFTNRTLEGEILYRGDNVFLGYVTNRQELKELEEIEVLRTGDIGYLTDTGWLFITGRSSRVVKIDGVRYNLDYFESVISKAIGSEAFVVSPAENAVFVLSKLSEFFIRPHCSQIFSIENVAMRNIHFLKVTEFPILANGKPDYFGMHTICKEILSVNG